MRLRLSVAVLLGVLAAVLPLRPAAAAGPATFTFTGSGFGHGVGMSQWGAYGQSLEGRTAPQILQHYYQGTSMGTAADAVDIRVSLIFDTLRAQMRGVGGSLRVSMDGGPQAEAPAGTVVEFGVEVDKVTLAFGGNRVAVGRYARIQWDPSALAQVVGPAEGFDFARPGNVYRYGFLDVQVVGPDLEIVNQLKLHPEYLNGIAEVPSSWPVEALRAQAIAARTYALRKVRTTNATTTECRCHVYDSVRDQVFAGFVKESSALGERWVAAVRDTGGQVVVHEGQPISANYFSSSGGRTQNNTDGFGSSTQFPYLRSVDDRWSLGSYNPLAAWERTRTNAEVAAAFGLPDVVSLDLSDRTVGQALRTARATASSGQTATLTGTQFVSRLSLPARWVGTPVVRTSGADRYGSSVAIGRVASPSSTSVVVVSGETANLVDGLVAGPFAKSKGAPVLLTGRAVLPAAVSEDIDRRRPSTAYIIGGDAAVDPVVAQAIQAKRITVVRIAGGDRYDTAARVAAAMGNRPTAVVASGVAANLVDALAAGAPAGAAGHPILLTARDSLPEVTRAALRDRGVTATKVAGGPAAVSDAVVQQLPSPTRLAGGDRYATSTAIAAHYEPIIGGRLAAVASGAGSSLVDALPGGALGGLLVLTDPATLPESTRSFLAARTNSLVRVDVLGGRSAVGDAVFDAVRGAVYP